MGIYLHPGNESFREAVCSKIYVDKSMLIAYTNEVLDTNKKTMCVSRPRRFGKSMAAEMLAAYYDESCDSRELFQNLKIAGMPDYEKHLNQYCVLYVDMNSFCHKRDPKTRKEMTPLQAVDQFHMNIIGELRELFGECVAADEVDLPSALLQVNCATGKKFIIIIDEWDTIFRENKQDLEAQKAYLDLLRGLFKDAASKRFLKLAYLTGILPIKKYGTQSALNNFDEFTMLQPEPLTEFVGFTEEEVRALYEHYGMDFEQARDWYDGYLLGDGIHIYNPKSVVDSIYRKKIANYWTRTETYESLKYYINMNFDGLKDAVVQILAGGKYKVNPDRFQNDMVSLNNRDHILTLLVHLGYLAYSEKERSVYVPNEEVRSEFQNAMETGWEPVIAAIEASDRLLRATWQMDCEAVAKGIDEVHMANTSILQYHDENSLSCVISLAYYHAMNEYTLIRELPTGKGYADIVFLPRRHSDKPAMIVELKYQKSAEGAIHQIKEKRYLKGLEEYKGNLLLVGINYDKKTKMHTCRIERVSF